MPIRGYGNFMGFFGTGTEGDVTISTNTTLAQNRAFRNLTISSSAWINTNGWRLFVRDKLTFGAGTAIINNGTDGSFHSDGTNCAGGVGVTALAVGGSGAGGLAYVLNTVGVAGTATINSYGGAGGAGGVGGPNGVGYAGGIGGTATVPPASLSGTLHTLNTFLTGALPPYVTNTSYTFINGGGGGGGGGAGSQGNYTGGSGGGGGGVILICAGVINMSAGGYIQAVGGAGGFGAGNQGGGGGGGGGVILLMASDILLPGGTALASVLLVNGGARGECQWHAQNPAIAGSTGYYYYLQV